MMLQVKGQTVSRTRVGADVSLDSHFVVEPNGLQS